MSITKRDPNTILLSQKSMSGQVVNDLAASEAITPGHLIEKFNNGGIIRVKKHATAAGHATRMVALEQSMLNKGVDDAYAAADLVEAATLSVGDSAWMFIASGQTIVAGNKLESAGDGTLRIYNAGVVLFEALENKTAANTGLTRIRVEAAL